MTSMLWFALFGGHLTWSVHLLLGYFLADLACGGNASQILVGVQALTIAAAASTVAAGAVAARRCRRPRHPPPVVSVRAASDPATQSPAEAPATEYQFLAHVALVLNSIFLLAILLAGAASFVLPPCA